MFELLLKNTNEFDKIYMWFSKYVSGVHLKAGNFAVISELGQLPLIISNKLYQFLVTHYSVTHRFSNQNGISGTYE